jgi:hypothetical protein
MVARTRYPVSLIKEVLQKQSSGKSIKSLSKEYSVPYNTISSWMRDGPGKQSKTKSELLSELSDLILRYGPEITWDNYQRLAEEPGAHRKHWASWIEFRFEAARLCPYAEQYNIRRFIELKDGILLTASDLHYWPMWGASTAHRGLCYVAQKIKPSVIVLNGDVSDLPGASSHRPIAWKKEPKVEDELVEVETRIGEIKDSAPGADRYINWGNHDIRFDNRLAEQCDWLRGVSGSSLVHHFPEWKFQNAIRVNEVELEIKHRNKSGQYAPANNVKDAGFSYCSGHDHNFNSFRWANLRGTFWGIDTGMGAEPWGPQFEYRENNTANWASGFAVLTFIKGKLQPPEMVPVIEPGVIWFRGERVDV